MKAIIRPVIYIGILLSLALFISGCTNNLFSTKTAENEQVEGSSVKSKKTTAVYYDFDDILIPMELKVVKDRTVVVSTPGIASGIITLKGRVERRSLFNFFNNNMQNDNWNVISQIKSPGTTILVFQKTNRTSVITIRDEQINTWVEVSVAPTLTIEEGGFKESVLSE